MNCVGVSENSFEFGPLRKITFFGAVPWSPIFLPSTSPLREQRA